MERRNRIFGGGSWADINELSVFGNRLEQIFYENPGV